MNDDFVEVVRTAVHEGLQLDCIAELAIRLAASGSRLDLGLADTADIASTGGPTSLSTLLCPPMLVATGWHVPKLGVPGRPAGGVDVLGTIPGYRTTLDAAAAERVLAMCNYVHVDAGATFAPADAALFRYRQQVGAQAVPDLAIASLLSKKISMGVKRVGLEVRVAGHGNFGSDFAEARQASRKFCNVARMLGMEAICLLTDASRPFQPFVGRGEALLALKLVLDGDENDWLAEHVEACTSMVSAVGGKAEFDRRAMSDAAIRNIEAQGGSERAFREYADEIAVRHNRPLVADTTGHVRYDLHKLRTAVMQGQGTSPGYADDAGLILRVRPGDRVEPGEELLSIRCPEAARRTFEAALRSAITIDATPAGSPPVAMECVHV
jgi:pyrimidine-nucleoside phosphorylase